MRKGRLRCMHRWEIVRGEEDEVEESVEENELEEGLEEAQDEVKEVGMSGEEAQQDRGDGQRELGFALPADQASLATPDAPLSGTAAPKDSNAVLEPLSKFFDAPRPGLTSEVAPVRFW